MISTDISQDEVKRFKILLNYFQQLAADGVPSLIEKQLLLMLDYSVPFFSHLVMNDVFPEIHRLTVNKRVIEKNKRIWNINDLKYPPEDKVSKYGRCNYRNQSILYASYLDFTAINESQPKVGEIITESIWRVKDNQPLKYCPIFKNQPSEEEVINPMSLEFYQIYKNKIKNYPEFAQEQIDALVQFVADAFSKQVNPVNDIDYIFSAYFSNIIFNEFENGSIDAISYPSVKNRLSFENLAIKPDVFNSKYKLVEVRDSVCLSDTKNGNRVFSFDELSECKSFDYNTDKILWDFNKLRLPPERLLELKMQFGVNLNEYQSIGSP